MDVIRFAVIVAWTETGDRAYSVLGLDERYKPVALDTTYVGQSSQVELLRQYMHDITARLEDGQQAVIFTNHVTARTKRQHVSDFARVHVKYSKDYAQTYRMALQTAIEKAKKGTEK